MPFTQTHAPNRPAARRDRDARAEARPAQNAAAEENPWREAAAVLGRKARDNAWLILLAMLAGAALAGAAKMVLPGSYKASAQILIDPQENRAFAPGAGETAPSPLEASAAVNYVESQMGVIGSERVLLRVIRDLELAGPVPDAGQEGEDARRARELAENKALLTLQKAVRKDRAERSFLIDLTVTDKDPEKAARIANAWVKAYGEINQIDRNSAARALSADVGRRIEDMRSQLSASETRLLAYKTEHRLTGMNDKTIAERRANEAADLLSSAENREAQARARLKQLEGAGPGMGNVGGLGSDPESRQLQSLIEGRTTARAELEQLEATLGERHPTLVASRARVRDFDNRIAQGVAALRQSARAQLVEAQGQTAALERRLSDLAGEMSRTQASDVSLRQMEESVESKRKALTLLEARERDANDMSRLESASFRLVSPARIPNTQGKALAAALWSLGGALIGGALALGGLALAGVFEIDEGPAAARRPQAIRSFSARLPVILPASGRGRVMPLEAMEELERRPRSDFARHVASLYRDLAASSGKDGPVAVVVAATAPQSGASTLAANLARAAAASGARALLIDANEAYPSLDRLIPEDAPKTLIDLAGRTRPLYRLAPFELSLSLLPVLAKEDRLCRVIADENLYRRVSGVKGNFDFIVFDAPDASDEQGLRALLGAADRLVLIVGDDEDAGELARRLRRLGVDEDSAVLVMAASQRLRRVA